MYKFSTQNNPIFEHSFQDLLHFSSVKFTFTEKQVLTILDVKLL